MFCPFCHAENDDEAEACFTCGRALYALTQGILLAQRYEILSPLGSGGMGRVYKAHDQALDEYVAIKVLRSELVREPEMARRFLSEIKLARKVSHRNVCRIHEYGVDGGLAYISMEYVDGKNLREFLAERSLAPEEALELAVQVAEGLQAVHDHGIVHRDFKASNIMIDRHGVVKLMDFGIAKSTSADSSFTTSSVFGTPEYMSPEQAAGARVDPRSDLYSLGCVVYEAFTGAPPFRGATPLETMRLHEHEPPPLETASIPEPVRSILRQALAKDPARRFASAAEFNQALRRVRAELGLADSPRRLSLDSTPFAPPRPSPPTRTLQDLIAVTGPLRGRRRAVALALGGVALVVLGLSAVSSFVVHEPVATSTLAPPPLAPPADAPAARRPSREPEAPVSEPPRAMASPRLAPPSGSEPQPESSPPPMPHTMTPVPTADTGIGTLSLLIVPESEVTIDGTSIGWVSKLELPLAAGPHTVRVLHPDYKPLQRKLNILAGVATPLVLDLSEKGIRIQP